mgnify:CR=1 FL=1|tara:strand:- start:417 stop:812 length:396 start_codon:yes stop_codon:yes gene_type:complete
MAQQPIELILARQFADSMSVAVFIVDPEGFLLFCNEPAEEILGIRYAETGVMAMEDWASGFTPTDSQGSPIPPEEIPLVQTLHTKMPAHGSLYIYNRNGEQVQITVTSIPVQGRPDKYLGAMAFFWKSPTS